MLKIIGAAGRIRTGEPLRERILSPSPLVKTYLLTWLGDRRPTKQYTSKENKNIPNTQPLIGS